MQIIRIDNAPKLYLERVVLPGQCLCFRAPADEYLDILTSEMASAVLQDRICCMHLQVNTVRTFVTLVM
jgi:hypothetical protein